LGLVDCCVTTRGPRFACDRTADEAAASRSRLGTTTLSLYFWSRRGADAGRQHSKISAREGGPAGGCGSRGCRTGVWRGQGGSARLRQHSSSVMGPPLARLAAPRRLPGSLAPLAALPSSLVSRTVRALPLCLAPSSFRCPAARAVGESHAKQGEGRGVGGGLRSAQA